VLRILRRLGFDLMPETGEEPAFTVQIPSWRLDVEREIDLIEEIARLHGYDKFANTLPPFAGAVVDSPDAKKDERVRSTLLALGYHEAISMTFISHEEVEQFAAVPVLELANPLSEEASVMRSSMVPGMLHLLAYNLNRGSDNVRLFESGHVFERAGDQAVELKRVCLGATGNAVPAEVYQPGRTLSFFDMKGDVENLLRPFPGAAVYYDLPMPDYYHPARAARAVLDGTTVAQFGQIHPEIAAARKFRQDVFVAEVFLDRLYKHGLRQVRYTALPRYPGVRRDFSFVFDDSVEFEKLERAVARLGLAELTTFVPLEIFRGGTIPAGECSLLLRATFQSGERTLREDEVAEWSEQIVQALKGQGGKLRQ
jgi:phenylalanyl-tRNA synthetase beta chain